MATEYFSRLYTYDNHVNRQVLAQLRQLGTVGEQSRNVFSHLLQAKKLWMWRMRGEDYRTLIVWPELSWEECELLIEENEQDWTKFIAGLDDVALDHEVAYTNSKGNQFSSPIREILTHVLIHGGYHRGQIASAVRRGGAEPLLTDYIAWTRGEV
ncbi:MAG: hypothetical protein KDD67_10205 [Ignavibacteriae bacterium]|nr:hypothetical protein [Ignavibacteriota bacterium]MCB9214800.1 hypothetical protein [Ignavibacteria bacterium]